MRVIDPSVIDENDPLAADPALDMYNPDNGFRLPPEPSRYGPEFVARYREAQRARVARLDAIARHHIAGERHGRARLTDPALARGPLADRIFLQRRAVLDRIMVIYRTTADLAYLDLSMDPSDRRLGDLYSDRPDIANYGSPFAFGRVATPRAWLSTWSGLSSRASLLDNLLQVTVPTLVLVGAEDTDFRAPADYMAGKIPGAELVVLDKAGHGANVDQPEAFNRAMLDFLDRRLS